MQWGKKVFITLQWQFIIVATATAIDITIVLMLSESLTDVNNYFCSYIAVFFSAPPLMPAVRGAVGACIYAL